MRSVKLYSMYSLQFNESLKLCLNENIYSLQPKIFSPPQNIKKCPQTISCNFMALNRLAQWHILCSQGTHCIRWIFHRPTR